jgi:CoA-transferase family III
MDVAAWASSGAMSLTGWPHGAPLMPPGDIAGRLGRLTGAIEQSCGVRIDWADLISGRAAMLGFRRQGRTSAGGSCRLVRTSNGWVALNLPRREDVEMVPALLGRSVVDDPWSAVEHAASSAGSGELVERAQLLGLPASELGFPRGEIHPARVELLWPRAKEPLALEGLVVVDLSAMWAGPLAAAIMAAAGAEVVKVESLDRPDGARAIPQFYGWIHPPSQKVTSFDFSNPTDLERLRSLISDADVVIEASRPRALRQFGLDPCSLDARSGRVWLSITGYGRDDPSGQRVAFGDDAAVAGGLVAWDDNGEPVFCADAIADPLSGMFGARAVAEALGRGGGELIDLAMARCAAAVAYRDPSDDVASPRAKLSASGIWQVDDRGDTVDVAEPRRPERLPWRTVRAASTSL